ncbi:E3 ubiquitin protein ligase RING1-like protein [Tanacetum coccineum]
MASELEREAAALAAMLHHFFTMTRPEPETLPDQILLFNMRTQSFLVIGGEKEDGEPPASKAAIEKMPTTEIKSREEIEKMCERTGTECVICMEDWGVGDVVKEMPCSPESAQVNLRCASVVQHDFRPTMKNPPKGLQVDLRCG